MRTWDVVVVGAGFPALDGLRDAAWRGARALAPFAIEAVRSWRPELVREWSRAHEETIGSASRLCRALASALRRPAVSGAALRVLGRLPGIATPLVRRAGRVPSRRSEP